MVDVTFLSGLGEAEPSTYFELSRQYDRTLRSGAQQAFFSDRTIYDSTVFTTQTNTSYLGHVIIAPNGKLGFDPDGVIFGTIGGSNVRDFLAGEIANGRSAEEILENLLAEDDVIRANDAMRNIYGYGGDDVLIASRVSDTSLYGGAGDDVLVGRPGYYGSYGGSGADTFVVTGTGRGWRPSIAKDFEHRIDKIALDDEFFQELGGKVTKQNIVFGTAAVDPDDRLVVSNMPRSNQADVFFDRDGSGPEAQMLVGHVTTKSVIRKSDFMVVDADDFLPNHAPAAEPAFEPSMTESRMIGNREAMIPNLLAHMDLSVQLF
ncbi:hypothetical protein [Sphingomonas sp.]|uniref:hypothetical protein n=1 Tax=Sphingomonas sp. TaxID=28214 RepID=UPI0035C7B8E5